MLLPTLVAALLGSSLVQGTVTRTHGKRDAASLLELYKRHSIPDTEDLGIDLDLPSLNPLPPAKSEPVVKPHLKQVTTSDILARRYRVPRAAAPSVLPPTTPVTVTLKAAGAAAVDNVVFMVAQDFPFQFQIFGKSFDATKVTMSVNGWLRFGGDGSDSYPYNGNLPEPNIGDRVLFPFWDDLKIPKADSLSYTYNNKGVTFDWMAVRKDGGKNDLIHFQVRYDVDNPNVVQYIYLSDSNADAIKGSSATIGLQTPKQASSYTKMSKIKPGTTLVIHTNSGKIDGPN